MWPIDVWFAIITGLDLVINISHEWYNSDLYIHESMNK